MIGGVLALSSFAALALFGVGLALSAWLIASLMARRRGIAGIRS